MKAVTKSLNLNASLDSSASPATYACIYKCPTNVDASFIMMYINNTTGSNKNISVALYKNSVYYPYLVNAEIDANKYIHIYGGYVVLEPGDEVRVTKTESGSGFTIFCTFEESTHVTQSNSGTEPYHV